MTTTQNAAEVLKRLQSKIAASSDPNNIRLTIPEAAAYIPMQPGQLAQLRYTGTGPKFLKPTARTVLYRKGDVDAWLDASVRTSTAEAR
ncbi:helix-turn-helix transcriptional regulator [Bifidobacterium sp.]|uniref:helix-turn-helix transcriptional regulator n=1 Tax=Bifidobacterium sp. TaxID=41200 RepID=UPI0025BE8E78|nr:hypothetical protein [Bifidobacterium sp.]MCH4209868.1 hypothetical protein [Bifidobacterium sp.]MCI1224495.1 hypothetical protein [Bifidobacterium sp.]